MTRIMLLFVISAALLAPTSAQTQPDFSGTWAMDEKRSGSPTHESFVGPVVWLVQQSPKSVVVERRMGDKAAPFNYVIYEKAEIPKVDRAVAAPSGEAPGHRAYWDGDRLVLETHQNIQGKTVTTREVLTLVNDGRELLAERVLEVEHGYTMKGAQNFSAVKDFFTKQR
jgi:hypothetical protein